MKLLLIEDDEAMVACLRRGLRATYVVDVAATGSAGIHEAEVGDHDAVVLDLGLPDMPGVEVCRALCSRPDGPPVLVLTGTADVDQKVGLLDAGADDYLTKPFRLEELKARLRVLVRRERKSTRSSILSIGDLRLDTARREVERQGCPIRLRRKEFDLLEYLMHNAERVITRAMIMDHVWDVSDNLWNNSVDVHIKYLRDKVDRPFSYALITTVHGVGYKLQVPKPVAVEARV